MQDSHCTISPGDCGPGVGDVTPQTQRTELSDVVLWAELGVVAVGKPTAGEREELAEEEPYAGDMAGGAAALY